MDIVESSASKPGRVQMNILLAKSVFDGKNAAARRGDQRNVLVPSQMEETFLFDNFQS